MLNTVNKLFKDSFTVSLSVFDSSRGHAEGEEHDKVLAFYPPNTSTNVQCSIVGLAQAVITFSNTFNRDEGCELMEAESNRWITFHCEPNIWMLLIVKKAWVGPTCPNAALHNLLRQTHAVFTLLHGPVTQLLHQDETGALARLRLGAYIQDVAERLQRPDSPDMAHLTNPLSMAEACPFMPIPRKAFLGVQALVNNLLILTVYGARVLQGCLILLPGPATVLWSSLSQADTRAAYSFAAATLMPSCASAAASLRLSASSIAARALMRVTSSTSTLAAAADHSHGGATSALLPSTRWAAQQGGFLAPDPTSSRAPSRHSSGAPSESQDAPVTAPRVYLQGAAEASLLLPYQQGPLLVLLFLHDAVTLSQEVLGALQEVLVPRCNALVAALPSGGEVQASTLWHQPGYRYLYLDHLTSATRASPSNKVATLGLASRAGLAELRNCIDLQALHTPVDGEDDWEVLCRAHHDCWLAARGAGPRSVIIGMEQDREDNLLGVGNKVQQLCDEQFPGVFEI